MYHDALPRLSVTPIQRSDLNQEVYLRVKHYLITSRIGENPKISLQQLAETLNVSRSPVHQALTRLATEGLLAVRGRRGYFMTPITAEAVVNAYDIREALELHAADHTVSRITRDQLDRLRCLADAAGDDAATDDYTAANAAFHHYLVELAGNPLMLQLYGQLSVNLMMRRILGGTHTEVDVLRQEHMEIVSAFEAGDPLRAAAAIRRHVETGKRMATDAIAAAGGSV